MFGRSKISDEGSKILLIGTTLVPRSIDFERKWDFVLINTNNVQFVHLYNCNLMKSGFSSTRRIE